MAIQFQCPKCSATIRVADAAAGKKGRCPQCGTSLLVPVVESPIAAPPGSHPAPPFIPPVPAAFDSPAPAIDQPEVFPPRDPLDLFGAPAAPVVVAPGKAPIARRLRRRNQFRVGAVLIPIVFVGILVGAGVWLLKKSEPKLEGRLEGVLLPEFDPPPKYVETALVELPEAEIKRLMEAMRSRPHPVVVTNFMRVAFDGTEKGLEIRLRRGAEGEFVRVNPAENAALRNWVRKSFPQLSAAREQALGKAATTFFRKFQRDEERNEVPNAIEFHESLGLATLVGPLGFTVEARVGKRAFPAVFEDDEGNVYFLLPAATRQFRIQGRKLADDRVLFPGDYTVRVAQPAPAEEDPNKEVSPEGSEPGEKAEPTGEDAPPEDGEMKKPGAAMDAPEAIRSPR